MTLGFKKEHAEVYIFLTNEGPKVAKDIALALGIHKRQLYRILTQLENKKVIAASSGYPAFFSAMLFEKTLDLFIEAKTEQQKALQSSKEELLSTWWSVVKKKSIDS